ncbi:MAG: hypothetical protein ACXW3L_08970 [Limisphaerales bacterium]
MQRTKISFQASESAVFTVAGQIYSAYIANGKITPGEERKWMERSLREAIQLAKLTEEQVQSDSELD